MKKITKLDYKHITLSQQIVQAHEFYKDMFIEIENYKKRNSK